MQYWLFKSEPDVFSIDDLVKAPKKTTRWDGVRNYQARNLLRDGVKKGDRVFFYHSNCKQPGIVGVADVVREAYADPAQFDPEHKYHDPKATADKPRWFCVDVKFAQHFTTPVTLAAMKNDERLANMVLLKQGRLSVQPVTAAEWKVIERLGK